MLAFLCGVALWATRLDRVGDCVNIPRSNRGKVLLLFLLANLPTDRVSNRVANRGSNLLLFLPTVLLADPGFNPGSSLLLTHPKLTW
ncbi:hypothetical protein [Chryseomicrobium palamuruense]|uniref:hypothetical protein n=1 Tax=Chryseomicrobium palamuruense TaxID=682973 RepID=UPI003A900912